MWHIKITLRQRLKHFFFSKHIGIKWTDGATRCIICNKVLESKPDVQDEIMGVAGEPLSRGDLVTIGSDNKIYKATEKREETL
jgi:hypothetical protein